jgi:hypothetical protein
VFFSPLHNLTSTQPSPSRYLPPKRHLADADGVESPLRALSQHVLEAGLELDLGRTALPKVLALIDKPVLADEVEAQDGGDDDGASRGDRIHHERDDVAWRAVIQVRAPNLFPPREKYLGQSSEKQISQTGRDGV